MGTTISVDAGPLSVRTYSNSIRATLHCSNRKLTLSVMHFNGVDNEGGGVFNSFSLAVKDDDGKEYEIGGFMDNDQIDELIVEAQASVQKRIAVDTPAELEAEPQYTEAC